MMALSKKAEKKELETGNPCLTINFKISHVTCRNATFFEEITNISQSPDGLNEPFPAVFSHFTETQLSIKTDTSL